MTLPIAIFLGLAMTSAADDPATSAKVVPAAEAKAHLDKPCTVEMVVRLSKNAETRKEFYLDSEADYHDEKNVAVVISYDALDAFKKAGIDDPSTHYKGKTIRVMGTPKREAGQVRMHVKEPKNITILKEKETR